MEATTLKAREFFDSRDEFVVYIQQLSAGDISCQDLAAIQIELHRIAHTLSWWKELRSDPNEPTCSCFADQCGNLRNGQLPLTVLKMFSMLALQVGKLTLDGRKDEYALCYDRMAKDEDRRWQIKSQGPDDGRAALLFGLWTRMSRTSEHCPNGCV
ncbi:hypothetical protein N7491_002163 [Penicillium cf. griseofulvum]|uniref:Uncharacterized protein n=1 Tax=Penicillium cf. griseofulvum TaxID=2972120 RepID=A0A9W9MTG5_9EURO|nr:hypothetical protein N7472_003655 [Penicillium cf. griseofulvum]KAJ5446081.1 hypothetical protein N7491_002163 [Penicillium cf. griseofulvum]KAJ5447821.1 hypothetical protein N7445_002642 [Penicillium cf. griseofulvum]